MLRASTSVHLRRASLKRAGGLLTQPQHLEQRVSLRSDEEQTQTVGWASLPGNEQTEETIESNLERRTRAADRMDASRLSWRQRLAKCVKRHTWLVLGLLYTRTTDADAILVDAKVELCRILRCAPPPLSSLSSARHAYARARGSDALPPTRAALSLRCPAG